MCDTYKKIVRLDDRLLNATRFGKNYDDEWEYDFDNWVAEYVTTHTKTAKQLIELIGNKQVELLIDAEDNLLVKATVIE